MLIDQQMFDGYHFILWNVIIYIDFYNLLI
jgi:hypothetical protein